MWSLCLQSGGAGSTRKYLFCGGWVPLCPVIAAGFEVSLYDVFLSRVVLVMHFEQALPQSVDRGFPYVQLLRNAYGLVYYRRP